MPRLALLVLPSTNRVYGQAAPGLAAAELRAFGATAVEVAELGGVPYVLFDMAADGVDGLGPVSALYALFALEGGGLRPVALDRGERFDDSLVTIQRYSGKTNEQFTKLLLNLAWLAAGRPHPVRVLDPLAGRGTTLNHALLRGWSAGGVERDGKAVDAYEAFLRTWLQDQRVKHRWSGGRVRREGRVAGRRFDVAVNGPGPAIDVAVVADDTRFAAEHFGRGAFDLVVADLPYVVQHRGRPAALVEESVGAWTAVLRGGGAMALACNVRSLPVDVLADVLRGAGLSIVPAEGFAHRVDQAIQRDVVVAVKAGGPPHQPLPSPTAPE